MSTEGKVYLVVPGPEGEIGACLLAAGRIGSAFNKLLPGSLILLELLCTVEQLIMKSIQLTGSSHHNDAVTQLCYLGSVTLCI